MTPQRIAICGGGAIGLFMGALLARAGAMVSILARPSRINDLAEGLLIADYQGLSVSINPDDLGLTDDPAIAYAGAEIVLVCVKSKDTVKAALQIRDRAPKEAVIVSLQNGLTSAEALRHQLPGRDVRAGLVGFNVAWLADNALKRATSGPVIIEGDTVALRWSGELGVDVMAANPIAPAQHAKLMLNLNNALNALSGLTLTEQFAMKGWRKLMQRQLREALMVMEKSGASIGTVGAADPRGLALALGLPGPLFRLVTRRRLTIDPDARSSMQDDLRHGRPTEIEELQGEILRRAERLGIKVPVTRAIYNSIKRAEETGGVPRISPVHLMVR